MSELTSPTTTTGCCPHGLPLFNCVLCHAEAQKLTQPPMGCICPAGSEATCKNPICPRGGGQPWRMT